MAVLGISLFGSEVRGLREDSGLFGVRSVVQEFLHYLLGDLFMGNENGNSETLLNDDSGIPVALSTSLYLRLFCCSTTAIIQKQV